MDDSKTLKNSEIQTELWAFSFTIKSPTKKSETNHSKKLLFSFLKYFPLEYGHQNELCKIERRKKCCCGLFISELNENGLSSKRKTKCDITLHRLYV
ncbi:unknown [Bacteroides sp. CAG:875]|nr:unknown [Bacteroides sp. CAG:875]